MEAAYYYEGGSVDRLAIIMMLIVVLVMLIAPLWILQALGGIHLKLGIISAFSVLWLVILGYGAPARARMIVFVFYT